MSLTAPISNYEKVQSDLRGSHRTWLVTGVAGFIGSNLLEKLLLLDQRVTGLDNLSTGKRENLDEVKSLVSPEQWERFRFAEGDICDLRACKLACQGADFVLHQAALGSVPRSIEDPLRTHASNVDGFINMLVAARDAKVGRFVYASSSSVYGDHPALPKTEANIGQPLSPYAATKCVNEMYARVFDKCYGPSTIGLRYFNVFGARQDPEGAYAAVIPAWFQALLQAKTVYVNGDGETSRDFCYVGNAVQANILGAMVSDAICLDEVYNIACGTSTTLRQLLLKIRGIVAQHSPLAAEPKILYRSERIGDVRHSLADISRAKATLGYAPSHSIDDGLAEAARWYLKRFESERLKQTVPKAKT
jgi:UDP-N-acetylglucosamine 4-epimerase